MDITIKDIPTQAQADRIKATAMRLIVDMEKPKITEEKQTEYETKIDNIFVANGLDKKFEKVAVIEKVK